MQKRYITFFTNNYVKKNSKYINNWTNYNCPILCLGGQGQGQGHGSGSGSGSGSGQGQGHGQGSGSGSGPGQG